MSLHIVFEITVFVTTAIGSQCKLDVFRGFCGSLNVHLHNGIGFRRKSIHCLGLNTEWTDYKSGKLVN